MTGPVDPNVPPGGEPPPPYGAPPPAYGAPPAYPAGAPQYGAPQYGGQYGAPMYGAPSAQAPGLVASMGMRLVARIIDGIITAGLSIALAYAVGIKLFSTSTTINADGTTSHNAAFSFYNGKYFEFLLITAIVGLAYEVTLIANRGATLGKMAASVKVVNAQGQVPGYPASLRRWFLPTLAGAVFSLVQALIWLSPFFDGTGRRQGWHDKFAGTFVIQAGTERPAA